MKEFQRSSISCYARCSSFFFKKRATLRTTFTQQKRQRSFNSECKNQHRASVYVRRRPSEIIQHLWSFRQLPPQLWVDTSLQSTFVNSQLKNQHFNLPRRLSPTILHIIGFRQDAPLIKSKTYSGVLLQLATTGHVANILYFHFDPKWKRQHRCFYYLPYLALLKQNQQL